MDVLAELVAGAIRLTEGGYYSQGPSSPPPGPPSLAAALRRHLDFPIIAEVKPRSPTGGEALLPASQLISCYHERGAAAISVLTEPRRFGGSLETLAQASATGLPALMKDVVVGEEQLRAAARHGASAVLVIESAFSRRLAEGSSADLVERAHQLGLEAVLEVSDAAELRSALSGAADLIGINQRDLRDLSLDLEKGARLLGQVPRERRGHVIVMSGIRDRSQVERARDAGAGGVLVGTALARSRDPAASLAGLAVPR
jgi:indole-3-glycerol phosphate synthase